MRNLMFFLFGPALLITAYFVFPASNAASVQGIAGRTLRETGSSYDKSINVRSFRTASTTDNNDASISSTDHYQYQHPGGAIASTLTSQASPSGSGFMNKYYYRFRDVLVSRNKITVYYEPGFTPPEKEHWVDFISGNTTEPTPPTMLVIKGDLHSEKWYYLPIEYLPAAEHQPQCTSWVEKPAYLLQVRYSYNIWHTWNEGLMGLFQTLREHGHLPLVNIDAEGNMDEIEQGMGGGCPYEFNFMTNTSFQPTDCGQRTGLVDRQTCNPKTESWCREGVFSYRRSNDGPIILPYTASSVMNVWAHLYSAMTTDVRDWSLIEGSCFKDLTVGKTSTLNFYQAVVPHQPVTNTSWFSWVDNKALRVEAMAVFKAFVHSAQREYIENEHEKNPTSKRWLGYHDTGMERLRQGIGPDDIAALTAMAPKEVPGMLREEMEELEKLWNKKETDAEPAKKKFIEEYGGAEVALKAYDAAAAKQNKSPVFEFEDEEGEAAATEQAIKLAQGHTKISMRSNSADGGDSSSSKKSTSKKTSIESAKTTAASNSLDDDNDDYNEEQLTRHRKLLATTTTTSTSKSKTHRPFFDKDMKYQFEHPRPVVTYASRNFFSRGVLNEKDILEYLLLRYNVTLKVTTFEEPLLEVMETLGSTDVFFGMHGAGWTNGLFIKRGATTCQMFPYGWRLPNNSTVRGYNYREIVLASESPYMEWVNPNSKHAFFRRIDYTKKWNMTYTMHPTKEDPLPSDSWPGNPWIYQNTYVDMRQFGPYIDEMMKLAGISPM